MTESNAVAEGSPLSRRPQTTQQYVLDELRRAIIRRELKPGEPIRQDALADRLGVSRVPLREALKILEGEGQVLYLPRRGYQIVDLSMADLVEVYHLRAILETEAIRLGVPALGDEDLDELEQLQDEIEAAGAVGDVITMSAANRRFHFLVFDLAGMPRLSRMIRNLWETTDAYRSLYYADVDNRAHVRAEHRAIVEAARARDVERFIALQDEHRSTTVRALSVIVDPSSEG
ncbi:GntR family transcriptional regulator [Microbacterium esteraromaticum]|uniref:GntR family transcriptional regulator n=1 Tax=Microbacterium esteraromaticum TaxID=57043 RepID=A0A7D7W907_9MICO|nr:GntR family transcriptional regulator [Microbacterium esteraromaticum]QMU96915.1 GntR family transcriptional regulator [Microbacterium esteraromaticum]